MPRFGMLLAALALVAFRAPVAIVVVDAFGVPSALRRHLASSAVERPRFARTEEGAAGRAAASASALFRWRGPHTAKKKTPAALLLLRMAADDDDKKKAELDSPPDTKEDSAAIAPSDGEEDEDEKEGSGLVTALLLGPPLFAKFVIVLCVKFLTDLVVFPLLFLYRVARLTKKRVLRMIGRGDEDEDDSRANGEVVIPPSEEASSS